MVVVISKQAFQLPQHYSYVQEVSYDAKFLASWRPFLPYGFVYFIVYSIVITILYHYSMAPHGNKTSYALRVAVAICRLLYLKEFDAIERKTGVKAHTAAGIMRRAINRAGNEDFHDVLACLYNANRPGTPTRIEDRSDLSRQVRQAILKHPRLPRLKAVQQENIDIPEANKKRKRDKDKPQPLASKSLLSAIALQHTHKADDGHIVKRIKRKIEPKKPRLNHYEEYKRDNLCI